MSEFDADQVVKAARSLLGVPWMHQGRDPDVGIDCVGLIVLAFDLVGEVPNYPANPHQGKLEKELRSWFGDPCFGVPRKGNIAAMAYGKVIRHIGIIAEYEYGGLSLIHTDSIVGKVVEVPIDRKWLKRIRMVFRP